MSRAVAPGLLLISLACACAPERPRDVATIRATRPAELARTEFAMLPGDTIIATTSEGTIEIRADDWLKRSYTWEGATWSVTLIPRSVRWFGSLGVYNPGSGNYGPVRGSRRREHQGINRILAQEGQRHFPGSRQALSWLKRGRLGLPFVYTSDGLMIGWWKNTQRSQINVEVWQVLVGGEKLRGIPGAADSLIRVVRPGPGVSPAAAR